MKSLLIKTLSVSLLLSAAMPFDVQAVDYVKDISSLAIVGLGTFFFPGVIKIGSAGLKDAAGVVVSGSKIGNLGVNTAKVIVSEARLTAIRLAIAAGLEITVVNAVRYKEVSKKGIAEGAGAGVFVGVTSWLLNGAAQCGNSSSVGSLALVTAVAALAGAEAGENAIEQYWSKKIAMSRRNNCDRLFSLACFTS